MQSASAHERHPAACARRQPRPPVRTPCAPTSRSLDNPAMRTSRSAERLCSNFPAQRSPSPNPQPCPPPRCCSCCSSSKILAFAALRMSAVCALPLHGVAAGSSTERSGSSAGPTSARATGYNDFERVTSEASAGRRTVLEAASTVEHYPADRDHLPFRPEGYGEHSPDAGTADGRVIRRAWPAQPAGANAQPGEARCAERTPPPSPSPPNCD